ncbi:hypothetical protein GCM10025867_51010 (plasmid) [Frondihabitans sucicola]|uniref:Uncharacterized protein n=1 Tax=Frondihabitans sucicola TaxID=1268041 RepID=A0ABN6Y4U3_9MICO|nr:hypothetical protein [Frondihabitans sucicola]BDZ52294.1 hypothetical protein GCM10025867_45350 [Frondihabitans sucicola]BDZ52860.1 hypothetical protein GCM10025867_51010 [Frondihabitans sucicola]
MTTRDTETPDDPQRRITDVDELSRVVWGYFGQKNHDFTYDSEKRQVTLVLYDAIVFKCGLGDEGDHGSSFGWIEQGNSDFTQSVFGRSLMRTPNKASIEDALRLVDAWARLVLPDRYLAVYDDIFDTRASEKPARVFAGKRGRGVVGHVNEDPGW